MSCREMHWIASELAMMSVTSRATKDRDVGLGVGLGTPAWWVLAVVTFAAFENLKWKRQGGSWMLSQASRVY